MTTRAPLVRISGKIVELPAGDYVSGAPAGANGTSVTSPLTTKGDIWAFSTVDARLPVGTNTWVLTPDSTQTLGIKWFDLFGTANTWTAQQNFTGTIAGSFGSASPVAGFKVTITADNAWPNDVTAGQLVLNGATTTGKRLVLGYDATNNAGFMAGGNLGVAWTGLQLQPSGGWVGIGKGTTAATALLHIAAGTTAASSAPLKLTSGPLMTSAEAGAVEFLTDKFYGSITTGPARKELALWDAAGTSGRVPYVTTNGRLLDSANFAWSNANTALNIGGTAGAATKQIYSSVSATGETAFVCEQTNQGVAAFAGLYVQATNGAGTGTGSGGITIAGNGYTPAGILAPNSIQFFHATSAKAMNISTNAGVMNFSVDNFGTACAKFDTSGNFNITEAKNVILGTTTGTKIGTATTQKLGFWNATPIAQKTGYGTPTGGAITANFPGATATLLQTAQELAQLILDLKAAGIIGA